MKKSIFTSPDRCAGPNRQPAGRADSSERVRKMGSTGDPPVPVGDPPTGRARRLLAKDPLLLAPGALPFRPASRRAEQASGLCYPKGNFRAPSQEHSNATVAARARPRRRSLRLAATRRRAVG